MGLFHWAFGWMCRRVFKQVDRNKNGKIEAIEVEIAVLRLYNIVNKRLPSWQDPPNHESVQLALKVFDMDGDGTLDEEEFEAFARSFIKDGPDNFFARVGKTTITRTAILPGIAYVAQRLPLGWGLNNVPLHFLAPALGVVGGAFRGLLPY